MGLIISKMGSFGKVKAKKVKNSLSPSLSWKLSNVLRWTYIKNYAVWYLSKLWTKLTGVITLTGRLHVVVTKGNGDVIDYGYVAHGLVTSAWVNFLVDNMQAETTEFGDLKYHDCGTGTTGATNGDTTMETAFGGTRATGTQVEGASANIYKSVGTITFSGTFAITEHGIFTQLTGGTLGDRHTFSAINVVNTDQIEFTYEYTATAEV